MGIQKMTNTQNCTDTVTRYRHSAIQGTLQRPSPALKEERAADASEFSFSKHGHPVPEMFGLLHEVRRQQRTPPRASSSQKVPSEPPRVRVHACRQKQAVVGSKMSHCVYSHTFGWLGAFNYKRRQKTGSRFEVA